MFGTLRELKEFPLRNFPNSIRLARGPRFINLDIMARKKDTVTRDDLSRFQKSDIANENLLITKIETQLRKIIFITNLDIDKSLLTVSNYLDSTLLFLFVQLLELAFLLPIIERTNEDLAM
jgi:hypothetical protein